MTFRPRILFNSVAIILTALTLTFAVPEQSNAQQQAPKINWQEIIPSLQRNNADAQAIARAVLKNDIKKYFANADTIFADFFNTRGVEKNSVIIVVFPDPVNCGNWGCLGYILKKNPGKENTWKIADQDNYNSILTSPELLAKSPSFYVMGAPKAGYQRFNAATGAFENNR